MFPANKPADAPGGSRDRREARRVVRPPDEALRVSRNEFAVVIKQSPVRSEGQQQIVERAVARSLINPFVDADIPEQITPEAGGARASSNKMHAKSTKASRVMFISEEIGNTVSLAGYIMFDRKFRRLKKSVF